MTTEERRELFAAVAKTPQEILDTEFQMWRDDKNRLPAIGTGEWDKMLKAVANIEALYAVNKATALLTQLNNNQP